jgi:hypothetical protein
VAPTVLVVMHIRRRRRLRRAPRPG